MITKFIKNLINLLKEKRYLAFLLNHKVFCCKNNNKLEMSNEIENLREVLEFIGEHIEEMKAEIQELQDEEIIFIFKNNKMKVEKEDIIWEIVKERIEKTYGTINQDSKKKENKERKKNKSILLGIIEAKYLKKEYFAEYIKSIEEEDIENEPKIFGKIREIIMKTIQTMHLDGKERKHIEHEEGKNFEGIIKYLENKYGENIHQQGIISITASSIFSWRPPERVIIYDQDTSNPWVSKNIVGSWLEINFKEEKVKINGYSLKSPQWGPHSDTLQNWVIDGSKDGKNWIEIDKRENDNYLNGPGYEHYYPISKTIDEFQYIRIRNTGQCHCGCSAYLALINFEVYGDITISNQKIDSK